MKKKKSMPETKPIDPWATSELLQARLREFAEVQRVWDSRITALVTASEQQAKQLTALSTVVDGLEKQFDQVSKALPNLTAQCTDCQDRLTLLMADVGTSLARQTQHLHDLAKLFHAGLKSSGG